MPHIRQQNDDKYAFWNAPCACGEPRGAHAIVEAKTLLNFRAREGEAIFEEFSDRTSVYVCPTAMFRTPQKVTT